MPQVVYEGVLPDTEIQPGNLFQDVKFFISQKVPQRSRFVSDVRSNGGEVVPLEKSADIKIVDHARKEALPGTYSYRYIEKSVRNGTLEDLETHRVGPHEGTVRTIASTTRPPKGTRNKYTQEDDCILWDWVHTNPQRGGGTDGREIYMQLEAKHSQHPWQSWRDRWIKQLKGKPRPFPLPQNAPPTPPSDVPVGRSAADQSIKPQNGSHHQRSPEKRLAKAHDQKIAAAPPSFKHSVNRAVNHDDYVFGSFDENDAESLMIHGESIMKVLPENSIEAWESWARDYPIEQRIHTAQDWQIFWEEHVRARYLKRIAKQAARTQVPRATDRPVVSPRSIKSNVNLQPLSSPATAKGSTCSVGQKSPSYHPESPSQQLHSPSKYKGTHTNNAKIDDSTISHDLRKDRPLAEPLKYAISDNLKRNKAFVDEEIPSSSPPGVAPSPKRRKPNGSGPIREIASTPEMTPVRSGKRPDSPLFIKSEEDEEDKPGLEDGSLLYESPLGKQASDTLSEPDYGNSNTQAVFKEATQQTDLNVAPPAEGWDDRDPFLREPTQQVDLEIPPPDDGWDDEDSGAEASSESEPIANESQDSWPVTLETQGILRGKTPAVDLDVPDPEGGWDRLISPSPPPVPSSPYAESEVSDVEAQTHAWIKSQVTEDITPDRVINVLKATSMDTNLAEDVLRSIGKNGGLPTNRRGVWTELDDEDLGATDARKIQKLESKHGKDCLTARWDFLNFYKTA